MQKIYWNGRLLGAWVDFGDGPEFMSIVSGGNTGSEHVASTVQLYEQEKANKKTLEMQTNFNALAMQRQDQQYKQNRKDLAPYTERGADAMGVLADLLGFNGEEARTKAFAGFQEDPGAQYSTDQANQALERSALARGGLLSGGTATEITKLNRGLADAGFNDYLGRLMNIANIGRGTASGMVQSGQHSADILSQLYGKQGDISSGFYNTRAENRGNFAMSNAQYADRSGQNAFDNSIKWKNSDSQLIGSAGSAAGGFA